MPDPHAVQREMWAAGDYSALAPYIAGVGERLVARCGVEAGMDVLDVACGTGNAALPAARAGGRVIGLDLTPALLEGGRRAAEAVGLEVRWIEGDAADLPFPDDSFDRVLSTFGHMFAPDHRRTADEMCRVCRPGGAIGICCWTPAGTAGRLFRAAGAFMPPPPEGALPPVLWGDEDHVRAMLGAGAADLAFEEDTATIVWESAESFADFFMDRFGPFVTARRTIGEVRFAQLRSAVVEVWEDVNEARDGSLRLPQEYLLSIVRR